MRALEDYDLSDLVAFGGAHEVAHRNFDADERTAVLADMAFAENPRLEFLWAVTAPERHAIQWRKRNDLRKELIAELDTFVRKNEKRFKQWKIERGKSIVGQLGTVSPEFFAAYGRYLLGERKDLRRWYAKFRKRLRSGKRR